MQKADVRDRMKELIKDRLGGRASDVFKSRVFKIIDDLSGAPSEMEPGLNSVRIAIKLHFDDELSEELYQKLHNMLDVPAERSAALRERRKTPTG